MYPVFVGPRVRAIAMDVMTVTTALTTFSTLYQPVFFAIVFVFDMATLVCVFGPFLETDDLTE